MTISLRKNISGKRDMVPLVHILTLFGIVHISEVDITLEKNSTETQRFWELGSTFHTGQTQHCSAVFFHSALPLSLAEQFLLLWALWSGGIIWSSSLSSSHPAQKSLSTPSSRISHPHWMLHSYLQGLTAPQQILPFPITFFTLSFRYSSPIDFHLHEH